MKPINKFINQSANATSVFMISLSKFLHPYTAVLSSDAAKLWTLVVGLLTLAILTGGLLIQQLWDLPLIDLWLPASQLSVSNLARQLMIVPTMLVAILAGGILGVVSVLLQQVVKNPLASDTTLAVGSGAQFALLVATLFVPSATFHGSFWIAFFGAVVSMGVVFFMALPSRLNPLILVLAGLVINILVTAMSSLLLVFFSEKALGVMAWGGGILTQISWDGAKLLAAASVAMTLLLLPLKKPLTLMSLDDQHAKSLGVPLNGIRGISITVVAVMTALVVSEVGVLSFVGLGAATFVNVRQVRPMGQRLLLGFVLGGLLLLITSNLVTLLMQFLPILIPAGTVTGLLGAPLIIWILFRQRRQHTAQSSPNLQRQRRSFTRKTWLSLGLGLSVLLAFALMFSNSLAGWHLFLPRQSPSQTLDLIIQFRLPRTLSAVATGVMLASAGVLIQTLTQNPMASPEVLGVSSGSAVGVLCCVLLLSIFGLPISLGSLLVAGTAGALTVLLLILWLARTLTPAHLLLVGIAIAALMNSVLGVIKLSGDPRLQAILSWLSGTTYSARPETVGWLMGCALVLGVASMLLIKPLQVISLGTPVAKTLGVNTRLTQLIIMVVVAGLSAAATLAIGPLSFIGLMVPHLATSLGAVQLERQLPLAMLLGAGLMTIADWLGRYVIFPYEIPAGTLASIIGALYFLWLTRRLEMRRSS